MNFAASLRWMIESYVLILAMLMLGLCLAAISMPRLKGVLRLSASMMFLSVAMTVQIYSSVNPSVAFVISEVLLLIGFALLDDTMTRFLELPVAERWVDALLFFACLSYTGYSMWIGLNQRSRLGVLILALCIQSVRSGVKLLMRAPVFLRMPSRFLAGCFFLFASFSVFRLIVPVLQGTFPAPALQGGQLTIDAAARLSKVVLLCASVAFGYLWMAALQLSRELDALSLTDPLTSTMNRRGLEMRLTRELKRARLNETRISLIALDVDHFKTINDRYGHHAGDVALVAFSNAMMEMLRPADSLGRFGGEEFVAILPGTNEDGARLVAQRLRERLRTLQFEFDLSMHLTASFGVAQCDLDDTEITALRRCDKALYAAKQAGRNCVVAYSQTTT